MAPNTVLLSSTVTSMMMMQVLTVRSDLGMPNCKRMSITGTTLPRRLITPHMEAGVRGTLVNAVLGRWPDAREPGRPALLFQKVPEAKVGKNRVHLDFRAEVRADEVARLVGLGATVVAERCLGDYCWTVLADPAGNEFCVSGEA